MTTQTQTETQPPDLLTLEDLAERLQLSVSTIRRMIAAGDIPAFKVGARVWRVRRVDYDGYLERMVRKG